MTTAKNAPRRAPAAKQSSNVDQLREDVESGRMQYPAGVPELRHSLAIRPRSRRAEFKRRYAVVVERYEKVNKAKNEMADDAPVSSQLLVMADMDDVIDAIDSMLRIAAVDEQAWVAWSDTATDEELLQVFNVYQVKTQPGEA